MAILVNDTSRIIVQGITGREAATFTSESIAYGAQIVAGITPGKGGQTIHDVPVYNSVAAAIAEHDCNVTIISVPPPFARDAALEAIEHGIDLVVIVTERIPRLDVIAILEFAELKNSRVIGPNTLGVITPHQTRAGMVGGSVKAIHHAYTPGPVGIISRSGGMMTEIASLLTQAGIGQSTCVSIGGDAIVGTTFLDLLPLYEADADTQVLVLFCEPGGIMEETLAEHLYKHPSRLTIFAFVAGRFTDHNQGIRFGHSGAIVQGNKGSPAAKIAVLRDAGIVVVDKLSQLPAAIRAGLR